jgi:hypothetical protein
MDGVVFFFCKYVSLSKSFCTDPTENYLPFSKRFTSTLILAAATIYIAFVIFLIDPMDFILIFRVFKLAVAL